MNPLYLVLAAAGGAYYLWPSTKPHWLRGCDIEHRVYKGEPGYTKYIKKIKKCKKKGVDMSHLRIPKSELSGLKKRK